MFRWVCRNLYRVGSARTAIWFAGAYATGLACMVLAFSALQTAEVALELPTAVYFTLLWPILAAPAMFASISIWAALRRDQVLPTAASLMAMFAADATAYFFWATSNDGNNDWAVLIQSLIGFHAVLILILLPIICWRFKRRKRDA